MIASELNLYVPYINLFDIRNFLQTTKKDHDSIISFSNEEKTYEHRNSRPYPWHRRVIELQGQKQFDLTDNIEFNKIYKVIDQLPLVKNKRNVLIIYQDQQPEYDFNFHFDGDKEYGFRICFNLDPSKVFLEFAKLKQEFLYIKENRQKIENHMVDYKIYKLYPSSTNTIFCINGKNFPHRVPVMANSSRLVVIVHGELDQEEFKKLNYLQVITQ